eukprot:3776504-Rhodomonas_salina.3
MARAPRQCAEAGKDKAGGCPSPDGGSKWRLSRLLRHTGVCSQCEGVRRQSEHHGSNAHGVTLDDRWSCEQVPRAAAPPSQALLLGVTPPEVQRWLCSGSRVQGPDVSSETVQEPRGALGQSCA